MDDDWDDGPAAPPSSFGDSSRQVTRGRGFAPPDEDNNRGGGGGFRGGRGDFGGRGGGFGGRGGGRGGGRDNDRGGRDGDRGGRRDGDWTCPDESCGNSNFAFRQQCQKCNADKPEGASQNGGGRGFGGRGGGRGGGGFGGSDDRNGGGRYGFKNDDDDNGGGFGGGRGGFGGGRGGRNENGDGKREGDWICPDAECGNSNFARRQKCQKCDTDKPLAEGEKPRPPLYIPPEPTEDEDIYASGISSGINFDAYENIKVKVTGNNTMEPIRTFEEADLRPLLMDNIRKSGYKKPTPIQKNAIPHILAGRDIMACAQTGSGKTAAFLIPIIQRLLAEPTDLIIEGDTVEPQAVIVSPTRELTIQIRDEARKFARGSILKIGIAYGGTGTQHQAAQLANGCHILVATPGRLNDFVNRGRIAFGSVRFFVLDEADRMLDMGFLEDMKKMLDHQTMVPTGTRQTLMFSATFPDEIQSLAGSFLHEYIFLVVGIVGGACADVQQVIYEVARNEKRNKLRELVSEDDEKVLVFVETKRNADFIAVFLSEQNIPTTSIHGDREQREREIALNDFKYNRMRVLVATAVAARGLDIKGVSHVINFDLPKSIDEYVHRIGRTGRVGNRGKATSFYDAEQDSQLAGGLVKILQQAGQEVPDWLDSSSYGGGGGYSGRNFGARDMRKADSFNSGPQPQAAEEEEEW